MWKKNLKKSWKCEYHYCIRVIKDFLWKWKSLSHVRLFANPWTVHGILQARILEWVAFLFSRESSQPRGWTQVSHIAGGFFTSWATRILWNPKNTGMGSLSLLQGIFPTQGSIPGLQHYWQILCLSHKGSPRILEWVAFSRESSPPSNRTRISLIAGGFFTNWAIREPLESQRGEWKSWLKTHHSKKRRSWHLVPSLHGK